MAERADHAETYPQTLAECHDLIDYYRAVLRQIVRRAEQADDRLAAWSMKSDATTGLQGTYWGEEYTAWAVPLQAEEPGG